MGCSTSRHAVAHSRDITTVYYSCPVEDINDKKKSFFNSVLCTRRKLSNKIEFNDCAQEQARKGITENHDNSSPPPLQQMKTSTSKRLFCSDASFSLIILTSQHSCTKKSNE
jgi:hypothetical protein